MYGALTYLTRRTSRRSVVFFSLLLSFVTAFAFAEHANKSLNDSENLQRPVDDSLYSSIPRGLDTFLKFQGTPQGGACVSTMIARVPVGGGKCSVAYITAAHCVFQGQNRLESMTVKIPNTVPVAILNKPDRLVATYQETPKSERTLVEKIRDRFGNIHTNNKVLIGSKDVAIMRAASVPCEYFANEKPARLASCTNGKNVDIIGGEYLTIQKRFSQEGAKPPPGFRSSAIDSNDGGGHRLRWRMVRNLFGSASAELQPDEKVGPRVQVGDSGSPVSNDKGEIVGVSSSIALVGADTGYTQYFDPTAVCRAQAQLKAWNMWPPVGEETQTAGPNSEQTKNPNAKPSLASAGGTPGLSSVINNTKTQAEKPAAPSHGEAGTMVCDGDSCSIVPENKNETEQKARALAEDTKKYYQSICNNNGSVLGRAPDGSLIQMKLNSQGQFILQNGNSIDPAIASDLKDYYISQFMRAEISQNKFNRAFLTRNLDPNLFKSTNSQQPIPLAFTTISGEGCAPCNIFKGGPLKRLIERLKERFKERFEDRIKFRTLERNMRAKLPPEFANLKSYPWVQIRNQSTGDLIWEGTANPSDTQKYSAEDKLNSLLSPAPKQVTLEEVLSKMTPSTKTIKNCSDFKSETKPRESRKAEPEQAPKPSANRLPAPGVTDTKESTKAGSVVPEGISLDTDLEWKKDGMWGKNQSGITVPLFINKRTGELLGGDKGEYQTSQNTKQQLFDYVNKYPERFNEEDKEKLEPFMNKWKRVLSGEDTAQPSAGASNFPPPGVTSVPSESVQSQATPERPVPTTQSPQHPIAPPLTKNASVLPIIATFPDGTQRNCAGTPVIKQQAANTNTCYYSFIGSDSCFTSRNGNFNKLTIGNLNLGLNDLQISSKAQDRWNVVRRTGPKASHFNYADSGILLSFYTNCDWLEGNTTIRPPNFFDTGKPSTSDGETLNARLANGSTIPLLLNFDLPRWSFTARNNSNLSQVPLGTPIYNNGGALIGVISQNHGNRVEIDPYTSKWITEQRPKPPVLQAQRSPQTNAGQSAQPSSSQRPPQRSTESPSISGTEASSLSPHNFSTLVAQKCNTCHSTGRLGAPRFPNYVMDWDQWSNKIKSGDKVAQTWLDNFRKNTVDSNAMLERAENMSAEEKAGFKDFVAKASGVKISLEQNPVHSQEVNPVSENRSLASVQSPNENAIKLTNPNHNKGYYSILSSIPTQDPNLKKLLSNFDIIYDKHGVIDAHQFPYAGTTAGIGARPLKLSPNPEAPAPYILNPNRTWKAPFTAGFGLNEADKSIGTFFLISLPKDASGRTKKLVTYYTNLPPDPFGAKRAPVEHTIYPAGTQVAEVRYKNIQMPNGETRSFVFEIDTRTKETQTGNNGKHFSTWNPIAYRPYGSETEFLKTASSKLNPNDYSNLENWVNKNRISTSIQSDMGPLLRDPQGRPAEKLFGSATKLPNNLSSETIEKLFVDKPLVPVKGGEAWNLTDGPFPGNYHSGAISVTTQTCAGCHAHTNRRFSEILPSTATFTAQYGLTPGSDGVLSFHRWDKNVLAGFNSSQLGQEMRKTRPELVGLYESYDARKHSASDYTAFAP